MWSIVRHAPSIVGGLNRTEAADAYRRRLQPLATGMPCAAARRRGAHWGLQPGTKPGFFPGPQEVSTYSAAAFGEASGCCGTQAQGLSSLLPGVCRHPVVGERKAGQRTCKGHTTMLGFKARARLRACSPVHSAARAP